MIPRSPRNPSVACGSEDEIKGDREGASMKRLMLCGLSVLALGANPVKPQGLDERQIVPLIKANWVALRNYAGRQFIYFSNLLAYRCGLNEIRYSVNSDALDRVFPLPPCNPAQPQAIDAVRYPPFVTLAPGTAKQVTVQATFKDGSKTDVVRFKPCPNVGDGTCATLDQ
jgi:hypothetical protein